MIVAVVVHSSLPCSSPVSLSLCLSFFPAAHSRSSEEAADVLCVHLLRESEKQRVGRDFDWSEEVRDGDVNEDPHLIS